jgi:hypothetical protein
MNILAESYISVAINLVFVHSVSTDFLVYYLIRASEIKDTDICRPRTVVLVLVGAVSGVVMSELKLSQ